MPTQKPQSMQGNDNQQGGQQQQGSSSSVGNQPHNQQNSPQQGGQPQGRPQQSGSQPPQPGQAPSQPQQSQQTPPQQGQQQQGQTKPNFEETAKPSSEQAKQAQKINEENKPLAEQGNPKGALEKAKKVLIVLPNFLNHDASTSIGLIYKTLKDNLKKEVDLAASKKPGQTQMQVLKDFGIDEKAILTELKPISYTISLRDAKDDIGVEWKKDKDILNFILTPKVIDIDFTKVSFGKQGSRYDLVITFNTPQLEDLGEIYSKHKTLFQKYNFLTIGNIEGQYSYSKNKVVNKDAYALCMQTHELANTFGFKPNNQQNNRISQGVIYNSRGFNYLQKYLTDAKFAEITKSNSIDLSKVYKEAYYAKNPNEHKLLQTLLKNIKTNQEKGIIYSHLSASDISQSGANPNTLSEMTHVPFNIPSKFRYAVLAFENNGKVTVMVEENTNQSIYPTIKSLEGTGSKYFGVTNLQGDLQGVLNRVISKLGGSPSGDNKGGSGQSSQASGQQKTTQGGQPQGQPQQGGNQQPQQKPAQPGSGQPQSNNPQQRPQQQNQQGGAPQQNQPRTSQPPQQQNQNRPPQTQGAYQQQGQSPSSQQRPAYYNNYSTPPFQRSETVTKDLQAQPQKRPEPGVNHFTTDNPPFQPQDKFKSY